MLPAYLLLVVRGQRSGERSPGTSPTGPTSPIVAVGRALAATVGMTLGFLTVFGLFGALTISAAAIVQRYLPEIVTAGDCRIILVDGEPAPFGLVRIPVPEDNRGNLAAGARAESRALNERDRWLCTQIGPPLRAAGMLFVGLDVIGDYVTEINVTSPTGIRELNKKHGVDIGAMLMTAIERRVSAS